MWRPCHSRCRSGPPLVSFPTPVARPSPINRRACFARGPSRNTKKRNGCRFDPLGARVAENNIVASASSGMGSGVKRRMARVVAIPSRSPSALSSSVTSVPTPHSMPARGAGADAGVCSRATRIPSPQQARAQWKLQGTRSSGPGRRCLEVAQSALVDDDVAGFGFRPEHGYPLRDDPYPDRQGAAGPDRLGEAPVH